MDKNTRNIIIGALIGVGLIVTGYYAYKTYNLAIEDATKRIKEGVREGVTEGVSGGIGDAINPLKLPGKIFGGG